MLPFQFQEDRMLDSVMLRLRTADGLDLNSFSQLYGQEAAQLVVKALQPHIQRGHAQLVTGALVTGAVKAGAGEPEGAVAGQQQGPQRVRLTDPHGFLVSNSIISDVFAALSELPSSL
jgi:oxygen-independent coproporphyrinogen-3 oxidase